MKIDVTNLKFDEKGLIPAIVQDVYSDEVLMLAYMNGASLAKTVETGYTWFWSRSRQELWNKGATSGHLQKVASITYDCDGDALLVKVDQTGAACHTGHRSCFFNPLWNEGEGKNLPVPEPDNESIYGVLAELYRVCPGTACVYLLASPDGAPAACTLYADSDGIVQFIKLSVQ